MFPALDRPSFSFRSIRALIAAAGAALIMGALLAPALATAASVPVAVDGSASTAEDTSVIVT